MPTPLEQLGVELVLLIGESEKNAKKYDAALAKVGGTIKRFSTGVAKQVGLGKDLVDSFRAMAGSTKSFESANAASLVTMQSFIERGFTMEQTARAMGISTQALTQQLREAGVAQQDIADLFETGTTAVKKQDTAIGGLLKKTILWTFAAASVYRLYIKLRRAIAEAVREVFENTQEYERLADATDELKHSLVLAIAPYENMLELLDDSAGFLEHVAMRVRQLGAAYYAYSAVVREASEDNFVFGGITAGLPAAMRPLMGVLAVAAEKLGILGDQTKYSALAFETAQDVWQQSEQALANIGDEAEKAAKQYEQALDAVTAAMRKLDDEAKRHVAALSEIRQEYEAGVLEVQSDLMAAQTKIEENLAKSVADITASAQKARLQAIKNYENRLRQIRKGAQAQDQRQLEQHQIQMEFARRRFRMTQIQNERLYNYNRRRLVAEGDVLAIEDLDARYELEKQAAEENFRLQQQQARALFEMQQRFQREAAREQIAQMQLALREQLAAIEENRRERIAEEEQEAAEARVRENEEAAKRLLALKAERAEALAEEEAKSAAIEKELGESLGRQLKEHELNAQLIDQLTAGVFGAQGTMVLSVRAGVNAAIAEAQRFKAAWDAALALTGVSRGYVVPGETGRPRIRGYQYGGSQVFSSPTMIEVGHGSEIVTVQPLSTIGGAMSHQFSGGIDVTGRGAFGGTDMSELASAIVIAMMRGQIEIQSGIRGEWGR